MSYSSSSGHFSRSTGGFLQYPVSFCGSSYPPNYLQGIGLPSPITTQLGYSGGQETFHEPTGFQSTCALPSPCQRSWRCPKISTFYRPYQTALLGALGVSTKGSQSFALGSPSLGFGNRGFQSVGCGPQSFSSLYFRPNVYRPTYFSSKSCQSVSYQPGYGSGCY
ncbi:keratin-associated protein 14-like [Thomomys bottae]